MLYSKNLKLFTAVHPCKTVTAGSARYRYILDGKDAGKTLVFLNGGMDVNH